MNEIGYRFTDKVERAIADEKARLLQFRKLNLITSEQVQEMFQSFLYRHMYSGRIEDDPDRAVGAKCTDCEMVHIVPVSLKHFSCKCTPRIDRPVALNRIPLA